jgi:hypothetical protein
MGEDAPLASNESEEGRALNRRVEVQVLPLSVKSSGPSVEPVKAPEEETAEEGVKVSPPTPSSRLFRNTQYSLFSAVCHQS